ncbi:MAG: CRTAC1 family protein [Planctomycetaceae bacterium]
MPADNNHDLDPNTLERDDAVIGTALKWSLIVIVLVAVIGGAAWFGFVRAKPVVVVPPPSPPPPLPPKSKMETPEIRFTDITAESGINFVHENGAHGDKLLPETMGSGCAFCDYDNDGDQDIVFVNSCRWPWDPRDIGKDRAQPTQAVYQNDGKGRFVEVTKEVGLDVTFYGMGVACGDYDNDGDTDLFFTAVGKNRLFRNDGGKFVEVTDESGVGGAESQWSTSAGWFDFDNDGDLDLFVANYIEWTREKDLSQKFTLIGGGRGYGRPQPFRGVFAYLYRNDGGGKFSDLSKEAGVQIVNASARESKEPAAKSLGITFADLDADGRLDVVIANDTVQNFLLHNLGDRFEEIGVASGIAFDLQGEARGAMGLDTAWFRNSPALGIAIGNFSNEMTALYVAKSNDLQFRDEAVANGLGPSSRIELKFGVLFADLDLDGRPDLFSANGHLEIEINKVQSSQHYEQPPHLFWNCGPDSANEFELVVAAKSGPDFVKPNVGRGAAYADIDGDGDLDLLISTSGQAPRLLRNDQRLGHHWVRFQLTGGEKINRDAIGAVIEVRTGQVTQRRLVMPTRSYLSQVELPVTFGLGSAEKIDEVRIRWPDGSTRELKGVSIDKLNQVQQTH